jgi:hypothetical protein
VEAPPQAPKLRVTIDDVVPPVQREFTSTFRIGRADQCDISIKHEYVSRQHVEISYQDGQWWVEDLNSSNGMFLDGKKIARTAVGQRLHLRLGVAGPIIRLEVPRLEAPKPSQPPEVPDRPLEGERTIVERYVQRYFSDKSDEPLGEHTIYMRRAAAQVHARERHRYQWLIAALALVLLGAATYAWRVHHQLEEQKSSAQDLFYSMKALDLDIGTLQRIVQNSAYQGPALAEIQKERARRVELEKSYDRFLTTLKVYDPKLTPKEKLILRVARIFGECELDMPKDFEAEIDRYIKRWQETDRLRNDIQRAKENGYIKPITDELLAQGLPPQFLYLALKESDFDPYSSGPPTAKGFAKGMWQFIPETALKYGLRVGPLAALPKRDPGDERQNFDKATKAAAQYLKDLYDTDAQASGFLVMACYNWGEGRVLPLVRTMPDNPRERNFWRLLAKYKDRVPQETYDYVFYIASAAVIGEDPRLFGFDFDNPLNN